MNNPTTVLHDAFFAPRQKINVKSTIPSALKKCQETGRLEAFKLNWTPDCGKDAPHVYWDSDVAKVLEGMAYVTDEAPAFAAQLDELVSLVISAQQPDGYLNTHYLVTEPEKRWSNLFYNHELYCAGHLTEAAVARFEMTGKRDFLDAMCRYCDYICEVFGKDGKAGYPGHEELELALVKLYKVTGNQKYLDQAKLFIDRRGTTPNYFVENENIPENRLAIFQAHKPVREQKEAVGHCVRALYLYSAMADVAAETGDNELLNACETLFDDLAERKIFITGGIGSQQLEEVIGGEGDQVPERSYTESCAAIAMVLFSSRMLKITGKVKYADMIERACYNCALAGISLSGDKFFYSNPHAAHKNAERQEFTANIRKPWHQTSCCPTNYCRFLPQLQNFCYRTAANSLSVDIPAAATVRTDGYSAEIASEYPYDGTVKISCTSGKITKLAVRIPSWCRKFDVPQSGTIENNYWYGSLQAGETLLFKFDMPVEKVFSRIPSISSQAAICRGPLVYCVEQPHDSELSPFEILLDDESNFELTDLDIPEIKCKAVKFDALQIKMPEKLYSAEKPQIRKTSALAIPYALWQNRGEVEMTVFMPCNHNLNQQ